MTGKTHRVGGVACCLLGYSILESKGLLVNSVNPLLQLMVMYPFSIYGSIVSDLDHHWDSCPSKDFVSFGINKVLHLTTKVRNSLCKAIPPLKLFDAKHRSWQTHSDLFLFFFLYVMYRMLGTAQGDVSANQVIAMLVFFGLTLGVISHMFLDMLTPEGIWSILFVVIRNFTGLKLPKKVHLVPKSGYFATDGPWERIVRCFLWAFCVVLVIRLLYLLSPYKFVFS